MKRILAALFLFGCCLGSRAGTLVYKSNDGSEKTVSDVKILSISEGKVKISVNKGIENISLGRLVKYFDTDVKGAGDGGFDETCEYTVSVQEVKIPDRGMVKEKGKSVQGSAEFSYSISRSAKQGESRSIRTPYFYLFVLTGADDGGRSVYTFSHPAEAKISGGYDEGKMLERVLSNKRTVWGSDVGYASLNPSAKGLSGTTRDVEMKLTGIGQRSILAWHLVVWGKDSIVMTRSERIDTRIGEKWYLNQRSR